MLTLEEKRRIAALRNIAGYQLLIDKVVKLRQEQSLTHLKLARGSEEIVNAAHNFRVWDDVVKLLEDTPREIGEELKQEGDEIYG